MEPGILFIGPRLGGGMSTVIDSCRAMFPGSMFISSYQGGPFTKKARVALKGLWEMWKTLRNHPEINIVHIHSASNGSFRRKMYFARLAKRMGRKVVLHIHGGGFRKFYQTNPKGISRALRSVDRVVCLSAEWAEFFRQAGVKDPLVIPNPVSDPVHIPIPDDGKVHFLFLGLLHTNKGIWDLVETVAEHVPEWAGKIVFHIAGTGPEENRLHSYVSDRGMESLISFEGWIERDQKAYLLSQAHALILPSYVEAMPVSILEAMSYGLPVVSTPVGDIPSVVRQGVNGMLIAPGDKESLAAAVFSLLLDPALRERMGRHSKELAKPYRAENILKLLQNLYSDL